MEMKDFEELSLDQQADLLQQKGSYIGKQKLEGQVVMLYQLEGFYAEIFYNQFRTFINRIESFTDVKRIDPYIEDSGGMKISSGRF